MEFEYVSSLCMGLVGTNEKFGEIYNVYLQNHPQSKESVFTYNEEFVNFMVKLLREGKDYDFTNYDKLEKVLEYISAINFLYDKRETTRLQKYCSNTISNYKRKDEIKELSDHLFCDSYLIRFEINQNKNVCKFFFYNVTVFKDEENAEARNLVLTFKDVKDIKLKGTFDFEFLKGCSVLASKEYKISDDLYCFEFLSIANHEHFIIEITFSNISVEDFDYDSTRFYKSI